MINRVRKTLLGYTFAIFLVALAAKGTLILGSFVSRTPLGLFYAAVVLSAWYGGIGPASCATVLAVALINYYVMPVSQSSTNYIENIVLLLVFTSVAALISYLTISRQRAERALRLQESKMLSIVRRMDDIFFAVDCEWNIVYINRYLNGYEGVALSEFNNQVLWKIYPQLVGTRFETECRRALASGKGSCFEETSAIPGKQFQVHLYASNDGLSIICLDITKKYTLTT